jgi:hypothetical protein
LFTAVPARDDFYQPEIPALQKYSEWTKLINVIITCLRFKTKQKGVFTPLEKIKAERAIVYQCKRAGYRATLFQLKTHGRVNHDSQLATLAPFLDKQGLIRLSGRTEAAPLAWCMKLNTRSYCMLKTQSRLYFCDTYIKRLCMQEGHKHYKQNYQNSFGFQR